MSTVFKQRGLQMSRCCACDHDLLVRPDGQLFCSNGKCRMRNGHPSRKYPTFKGATAAK